MLGYLGTKQIAEAISKQTSKTEHCRQIQRKDISSKVKPKQRQQKKKTGKKIEMIYEAESLASKRMSKDREDGAVGKMLAVKHTDQTLILRTRGKSHGKLSRVF